MKIILINNLYPPYIVGGNEILARDVVDELRRRGHEVHVVVGRGRDLPSDAYTHGLLDLDLDHKEDTFLGGKRPTATDIVNWHLFNWNSFIATQRIIRKINPDLVIIWNLYMASMAPIISSTLSGKPTVIQVADKWLYFGLKNILDLVRPSKTSQKRLLGLAQTFLQPILFALARPRHIITISEFIKNFYIQQGFDETALKAIPLGVPTDLFTIQPFESPGAMRFLYVGALWEGKGPQVAIRALGELKRSGLDNWTLDMYGDGTSHFKDWLKSIIREENLESNVILHGFASRSTILDAMQKHDILVFPSLWDEPFAAVPVEAMSCGLAIVATTAGGTPEAITHEETGLLVPPNDAHAMAVALKRVITDDSLRQRLGERAALVARERFDFAHYVNHLEEYYGHVVQNSKQVKKT